MINSRFKSFGGNGGNGGRGHINIFWNKKKKAGEKERESVQNNYIEIASTVSTK